MPGFINEAAINYLKKRQEIENKKRQLKQQKIDEIRDRHHLKTNIDIGLTKPPCGQIDFVKKGLISGIPGYKQDEEGVKQLFYEWAPNCGPSQEPQKDKNQIQINKVAIKLRAVTAKDQGAFRRDPQYQNNFIFKEEHIKNNSDKHPRLKLNGSEVFGKPTPKFQIGDIIHDYYGKQSRQLQHFKNIQVQMQKQEDDDIQNYRKEYLHTFKSANQQVKFLKDKMQQYVKIEQIKIKGLKNYQLKKNPEVASDVHNNYFNPQFRDRNKSGKFRQCFIQPALKVANIHS